MAAPQASEWVVGDFRQHSPVHRFFRFRLSHSPETAATWSCRSGAQLEATLRLTALPHAQELCAILTWGSLSKYYFPVWLGYWANND